MNDLRLELRARNNRLWHLIFDAGESVASFCRKHGYSQARVGVLLNLSESPYSSRGINKTATRIADVAQTLVEDLFPRDLYDGAIPRRMVAEIPSDAYVGLAAAKRLALPASQEDTFFQHELCVVMKSVLETLTPREQRIICARFGLDDGSDGRELEPIAQENGISRERVRQIEAKALRKLRHPSRARKLAPYLDAVAGKYGDPLKIEKPPSEASSTENTAPVAIETTSTETPVEAIHVYLSQSALEACTREVLQAGQELLDSMAER